MDGQVLKESGKINQQHNFPQVSN